MKSNYLLCGDRAQYIRKLYRRDDFTMRTDPLELVWRSDVIPLSPLELAMMERLMIHGRASNDAIQQSLGISTKMRDRIVHKIRGKAAGVGAPDPVETIPGWGIRFRSDPSVASRSIWIGLNEANVSRALKAIGG